MTASILREVLGESAAWRSWLPDPDAKQPNFAPAADQTLLGALRDDDVHATLRVGELLLPNIPAGRLDAKFSLAKDTLEVERLDFAAPGAVALNGNGRIERLSDAPAGQVDLSLQAMTADGLKVTSELLGLGESVTKSKQLASLAPLDMHVGLTAVREGNATKASVEVKGKAGGTDVSILAKATGDPAKLADAAIDIDGSVDGDRAEALLGLLIPGLTPERLAIAGADQGKFTFKAQGVPNKGVTGHAELATSTLQLTFDGQGSSKADGLALAGEASAKSGNAGVALALLGLDASPSAADVPLDLHADVAKTASSIDLKSISGQIAGDPVQGSAHIDLDGEQPRFTVAAKVVSVSLPSLLGSFVAWQRTPSTEALLGSLNQSASDVWPSRGFALEPLGKADGEIKIEAKKLTLGAPLQVDDAVLVARVDGLGLSRHGHAGPSVRRLVRCLRNPYTKGHGCRAQSPRRACHWQTRPAVATARRTRASQRSVHPCFRHFWGGAQSPRPRRRPEWRWHALSRSWCVASPVARALEALGGRGQSVKED